MDTDTEIDNEEIIKEWNCRQKLAREIQNIRAHGIPSVFDVEVEATMTFLVHTSTNKIIDGQDVWKSIGEVSASSSIDQCKIDDDRVVRIARATGADRFADIYQEYVRDYVQ